MTTADIRTLTRRVDHLTRAATRIQAQLADLHTLAYEPAVHTTEPTRSAGFESRPPPGANTDYPELARKPPERINTRDQARHLWARTETELKRCEEILVGLERAVTGWFMVTAAVEPSRGSLISSAEHDQLLANQNRRRRSGEYTPTPLVDQPRNNVGRRP